MINAIGVIGAGTMGNGIAQVAARAGLSVVMHDVNDELLRKGMSAIIGAFNATLRNNE